MLVIVVIGIHSITQVTDTAAIEKLHEGQYDVVLSDLGTTIVPILSVVPGQDFDPALASDRFRPARPEA